MCFHSSNTKRRKEKNLREKEKMAGVSESQKRQLPPPPPRGPRFEPVDREKVGSLFLPSNLGFICVKFSIQFFDFDFDFEFLFGFL